MNDDSPILSFGHGELDALFRKLPEFSSALLLATDKDVWKTLSTLVRTNVVQSARQANLSVTIVGVGAAIDTALDGDLAIIERSVARGTEIKTLLDQGMPLVCLAAEEDLADRFNTDLRIVFEQDLAVCFVKNDAQKKTFPCHLSAMSGDHDDGQNSICLIGLSNEEKTFLAASHPDKRQITPSVISSPTGSIAEPTTGPVLTLIKGPFPTKDTEDQIKHASEFGPVIFWPTRDLRGEDRTALFDLGCRSMLHIKATNEEMAAAIRAWFSDESREGKGLALDREFAERHSTMRKHPVFADTDEQAVLATYGDLVKNRMERAEIAGTVASALIFRLRPDIPTSLLTRLLLLTSSVVRKHDIVLATGTSIVVISALMSKIAANSVCRRLKAVCEPSWLGGMDVQLIKSDARPSHSQTFLSSVWRRSHRA